MGGREGGRREGGRGGREGGREEGGRREGGGEGGEGMKDGREGWEGVGNMDLLSGPDGGRQTNTSTHLECPPLLMEGRECTPG